LFLVISFFNVSILKVKERTMRTRVSMVIAVAVVMSFAAVADAQPRGPGSFGGRGGGGGTMAKIRLLRVAAIQKDLEEKGIGLSPDQIKQIDALLEELGGQGGRGNFQRGGQPRGEGDRQGRGRGRGRPEQDTPDKDDESRFEFQPGEYFVQEEQPRRRFQDLSEEERQKLRDDFRKRAEERNKEASDKLAKILSPEQLERLNEIYIQIQGVSALQDPEVAAKLKIDEKDREKMREVQQEASEKMREEMQELFRSGDRDKIREKFTEMRKDVEKDVLGVLSKSQQKQFKEMQGEPIKLSEEELRNARSRRQGGRRQGGRRQGGRGQGGGGQGNNDT
jgi:DNA-binding MarR family transcriptional regulator